MRRWLEVARAGRRLTDLQVLVEAFDRAPLDPGLRDWLYESLGLPVRVRLAAPGISRTMAKRPVERPVFQRVPLRRAGVDVVREATRPFPSLRRASPALAGELIETARVAMVTRSRELHAFSYPNAEDVLVGEAGRGLRVVLIGLQPAFRLPFEGYYAFLAIRNGVPVSYGGGWCLFETLEFGFNVFESFRQGESAWILGQALRAYHQVFGMRTVVVDPYQLGRATPRRSGPGPSTSTSTSGSARGPTRSGASWRRSSGRSLATGGTARPSRCSGGSRGRRPASRCPAAAPSRSAVCGHAIWPRW